MSRVGRGGHSFRKNDSSFEGEVAGRRLDYWHDEWTGQESGVEYQWSSTDKKTTTDWFVGPSAVILYRSSAGCTGRRGKLDNPANFTTLQNALQSLQMLVGVFWFACPRLFRILEMSWHEGFEPLTLRL